MAQIPTILGDGVSESLSLSHEGENLHEIPRPSPRMLSIAPASPRNSSKRFACDRCRGQKLRCVRRDTNHETCTRCLRMNAICTTNPPLRMGRTRRPGNGRRRRSTPVADERTPAATSISASDDHVSEMESGIDTISKPSRMPNISSAVGLDTSDANHDDSGTNGTSDTILSSLESSNLRPWQAQASGSMCSIPETLEIAVPGNPTSSECNSAGDGSMSILNWPSPCLETPDLFANLTTGRSLSEDGFQTPLPTPASHPPTPPSNTARAASPEHDGVGNTYDLSNPFPALCDFAAPGCSQSDQHRSQADTTSAESERSLEKDCIYLLSELSLSLYRQLLHFNSNTVSLPLMTQTCNSAKVGMDGSDLMGDILRSSEEFLSLINGPLSPRHQPPKSLPANVTFVPRNFYPESRNSHTRNSSLFTESLTNTSSLNFDSSLSARSSADFANISSASSRPRPGLEGTTTASYFLSKPDTPVILLVISCYVQIIRIYSKIFSHVHSSLLATVSGHTPSLITLPDFQISGFPLRSGILQVKILIEVVVHLLNQIENSLGLPMEYRVSSRVDRSTGMLSDLDLTELFKMIIKQEERGEVKSLREHIKSMKHLLENS